MNIDKYVATTMTSVLVSVLGVFIPLYGDILILAGLFSFSGCITNWIAIHMLFEKVPFFYGSGVILNRFEEFKFAIKNLVMSEFFTEEQIRIFFNNESKLSSLNIIGNIDFDNIYEELIEVIMNSKFGVTLSLIGGSEALLPLKDPIVGKLKEIIKQFVDNDLSSSLEAENISDILVKIESALDNRLNSLTPEDIKIIIQKMIKEHLGWLVVWGGVFGGLIGLISSLFFKYSLPGIF